LISFQGGAAPAKLPTCRCSSATAPVRDADRGGRCYMVASPRPRRGGDRRLPATLCTPVHTPATGCSKAPQGLLSPLGVRGLFAHVTWVHGAPGGDSGALVDPFMHVGTLGGARRTVSDAVGVQLIKFGWRTANLQNSYIFDTISCYLTFFINPPAFGGHRGPYPTRHLATLRESELLPAFTGPYTGWTRLSGTRTGQDSIAVQNLSVWRLPMFLLNSQDPLVTAT
jgi:hypothetical protein